MPSKTRFSPAGRRFRTLRDAERFDAWLHRLLVRICYRAARRNCARHTVEMNVSARVGNIHTSDSQAAFALRDELNRGFGRLSTEHRTVLVLVYYMGLSLKETADLLDVPLGTVQSRLNRAARTMRAALEADGRPTDPVAEGAR